MPNRIIKESVNESRGLSNCSFFAQDLYKRLIVYADDYGRFNADPQIMLARLYPRELKDVSADDLIEALIELAGVEKIGFYTSKARDEVYGAFPNWSEHQRVRDSKKKNPEPEDTSINDWYLRRFIPIDMKAAIIQRDEFKCAICGKKIIEPQDAKKLLKMCTGLFHFDHIVPCNQGGRATMENLRLTCPKCNLSRKRFFDLSEILQFAETFENSPQVAESFSELPPNPIQSNPYPYTNPNPNPNPNPTLSPGRKESAKTDSIDFDVFWEAYPRKESKPAAKKAFDKIHPDEQLMQKIITSIRAWKESAQWKENGGQFIPYPASWLNQQKWNDVPQAPASAPVQQRRVMPAQDFAQRDYSGVQDDMMSSLAKEMARFKATGEVDM